MTGGTSLVLREYEWINEGSGPRWGSHIGRIEGARKGCYVTDHRDGAGTGTLNLGALAVVGLTSAHLELAALAPTATPAATSKSRPTRAHPAAQLQAQERTPRAHAHPRMSLTGTSAPEGSGHVALANIKPSGSSSHPEAAPHAATSACWRNTEPLLAELRQSKITDAVRTSVEPPGRLAPKGGRM